MGPREGGVGEGKDLSVKIYIILGNLVFFLNFLKWHLMEI